MEGPTFFSHVAIGLRVNGIGHNLDFDARTHRQPAMVLNATLRHPGQDPDAPRAQPQR